MRPAIAATAGGVANDIKPIQVIVNGKNAEGQVIQETLPAFTENQAGTVSGALAFASVTSVVIPAHDGLGATTSIGYGDVLGLGAKLTRNTVGTAYLGGVLEGTAPTVVFDADELEKNTIDLNSALNSTQVAVMFFQP